MNYIRDQTVALDTNVFIFALRRDANYPACEALLSELQVYVPLQVFVELQHNLNDEEMRGVLLALTKAKTVTWDYAIAPVELVTRWEQRGAKKGDAVIAAHLEANSIRYLVSENRDLLTELPSPPFEVLSSEEALRLLAQ